MLRRKNRLPSSVRLSQPSTFQAPNFFLRFCKTERPESRLVVIISKKVDKRAVGRNRMRRLLSQFMQENWERLSGSMDMIIFVQRPFLAIEPEEKEIFLKSLISKGVFSEKSSDL